MAIFKYTFEYLNYASQETHALPEGGRVRTRRPHRPGHRQPESPRAARSALTGRANGRGISPADGSERRDHLAPPPGPPAGTTGGRREVGSVRHLSAGGCAGRSVPARTASAV